MAPDDVRRARLHIIRVCYGVVTSGGEGLGKNGLPRSGTVIALDQSQGIYFHPPQSKGHPVNAIELLESQHREVEKIFSQLDKAKTASAKQKLFDLLADSLAVHMEIEEHQFYPAAKAKRTEDMLLESLEEHLGIKRVLADLLETEAADETFDAKIKVLKEQVEHHVEEEETDLFPKTKKVLDAKELQVLGQRMQAEQAILEKKGEPRAAIPHETAEAAILS
jgi:hemerythrin superfamily protein